MINRFFIVVLLVFSSGQSIAKDDDSVLIQNGFIKGRDFRAFDSGNKYMYSMGLVDGILLSPLYGAPKSKLEKFESCTTGMNGSQLSAIFDKYLAENPERWHLSMHANGYAALQDTCNL